MVIPIIRSRFEVLEPHKINFGSCCAKINVRLPPATTTVFNVTPRAKQFIYVSFQTNMTLSNFPHQHPSPQLFTGDVDKAPSDTSRGKICFIFPRKLLGALSQGAKLKCTKWESLSFRNGCNYTVLVFVAMSSRYNYFCKYSGTRHPPPVNGAAPLAASSRRSWYYLPSTWGVSISRRIVPN